MRLILFQNLILYSIACSCIIFVIICCCVVVVVVSDVIVRRVHVDDFAMFVSYLDSANLHDVRWVFSLTNSHCLLQSQYALLSVWLGSHPRLQKQANVLKELITVGIKN